MGRPAPVRIITSRWLLHVRYTTAAQEMRVAFQQPLAVLALLLATPADGFISIAQRWPANTSQLWRPEEIALRGGAISALWPLPDRCAADA